MFRSKFMLAMLVALSSALPNVAAADSCWWHNGSLMRLSAYGEGRAFHYEQPRAGLAALGIGRGTMLFNGRTDGASYSGVANVFSSSCPGQPFGYQVQGPVGAGQTSVTLYGSREVRNGCAGTGTYTQDVLSFTYAYQC